MASYSQFCNAVTESVKKRVARFGDPESKVDEFLKEEESQIMGEYRHYSEGPVPDGMTKDAYFQSCVEGIAMCLEYCY